MYFHNVDEFYIWFHESQVGLIFDSDGTSFQKCGGTLVGDRYVITAAGCTVETSDIRVVIGDTTLGVANDTTRFIIRVSEIRVHPKFGILTYISDENQSPNANDIAVLVLSTPVPLDIYPNIKPACLPSTETKPEMFGRSAVASGWGSVGDVKSSHLNVSTVKILSDCGTLSSNGKLSSKICVNRTFTIEKHFKAGWETCYF